MDTFLSWLPDLNYWAVICALLVALNIWQYAKYHGTVGALSSEMSHIKLFGHAPAGAVVVPAASVTAQIGPGDAQHTLGLPTQPAIQPAAKRLPWEK